MSNIINFPKKPKITSSSYRRQQSHHRTVEQKPVSIGDMVLHTPSKRRCRIVGFRLDYGRNETTLLVTFEHGANMFVKYDHVEPLPTTGDAA